MGKFFKGKIGCLGIFSFSHHRLHSIGQSIKVTSNLFFSKKIGDKGTPEKILQTISYICKMIKFEKLFYIMDKNIFPTRPFYGRVEKENCQRIREKKNRQFKIFSRRC